MILPIGIIIGLINGLSLLLKWKSTNSSELFKNSRNSLIATVVLSAVIVLWGGIIDVMLIIFTFSSAFALFVNLEVIVKIIKGRKTHLGAYIAHIGIALFMLGVIATGGHTYDQQIDLVKGEPHKVLGYELTFKGYTAFEGGKKYAFNIDISKDGVVQNTIAPVMYIAEFNNSLMREPDILNMITKDFYVSPIGYNEGGTADHNHGDAFNIKKGSSIDYNGATITFKEFEFPKDAMDAMMGGGAFQIGALFTVNYNGKSYDTKATLKSEGGQREFIPAEIPEANLSIDMTNMDASGGSVAVSVSALDGASSQPQAVMKESLSVDASIKPFINLIWAGVLVMVFGFVVSVTRRTKESHS